LATVKRGGKNLGKREGRDCAVQGLKQSIHETRRKCTGATFLNLRKRELKVNRGGEGGCAVAC